MSTPLGRHDNQLLLRKLLVIAVLMFGFAWLLIPLYRVICEVTGLNQVVKADSAEAENGQPAAGAWVYTWRHVLTTRMESL